MNLHILHSHRFCKPYSEVEKEWSALKLHERMLVCAAVDKEINPERK